MSADQLRQFYRSGCALACVPRRDGLYSVAIYSADEKLLKRYFLRWEGYQLLFAAWMRFEGARFINLQTRRKGAAA